MKKQFILSWLILCLSFCLTAQEKQDQHLLDGTTMDYYYQNGSAVHAAFADGKFQFEWFLGPNAGAAGETEYKARKIGNRFYLVGFSYEASGAYVTIAFNFNENVFATSGWLGAGTDDELFLFEGGIIENLSLQER